MRTFVFVNMGMNAQKLRMLDLDVDEHVEVERSLSTSGRRVPVVVDAVERDVPRNADYARALSAASSS